SPHDSARGSPDPPNCFEQLVTDINAILGPCNGIDSAGVDVEELKAAMRAYRSREEEWSKYAFADYSRAYTRNLVDHGNGKSNLLVLVWTPGKASPVHDHANAHCVMKVLKGKLRETLYCWPCQRVDNPTDCATSTTYEAEAVTYMSDRLGLHRIQNPSPDEVAVSLHLYTPPNAAKHGCHIFDEYTGRKSHVQQCHFYSELGVK
ncbi:hypothetical protein M433DRAFT_45032, partial [Acidomyces richmondensis BFW]